MKVTKRKDGRYEATRVSNGERKHFIASTEDEVIIKYYECIMKERENEGQEFVSFKEVKEKWYQNEKEGASLATKRMYEKSCFPKIESLDDKDISLITKGDIELIMKSMKGNDNIASKVYLTLDQIFKYGIENEVITKNPMSKIKKPKYEVNDKSKRGLTAEEKKLLNEINLDNNEKIFVKLCLDYGCRRNEAVAVKVKDIDIDKRLIHIVRAFDYSNNTAIEKPPKSKAGKRDIPILEMDISFFMEIISSKNRDDYLISRKGTNKPLTNSAIRKLWERIKIKMKKEAKKQNIKLIDGLTVRMLRHEFAIRIKSLSIRDQMYLMGHSDYKTTSQSYQTIGFTDIDIKEYNKLFNKHEDNKKGEKKK